jgi:hypothetical protein
MKIRRINGLPPVLIVFVALIGCSAQHDANKDLRDNLRAQKIVSIEVFQIPGGVETPVAVTPDSIERRYHAKFELRASSLLSESDALDRALADTNCRASTQPVNVRTAILFFGEAGTKVRGFYYSTDGWSDQVDGTSCKLGSGLLKWAQKRLP